MSKNTRNRILLTAVAALLLLAVTVGGTLAYLRDTTVEVKNTFLESNLDITLQEHPLNEDGRTIDTTQAVVKENDEYKMVPGDTLQKDPFVTVKANSEKLWLFVEVIEGNNVDTYLNWTIDDAWTPVDETKYPGVYYQIVEATTADTDFYILANNQVTVDADVTNEQMAAIGTNKPTLTFKAYAVQYEYLVNGAATTDASVAWGIASGATQYGEDISQ